MGNFTSRNKDELNFNKLNTENYSATIPYADKLSRQSKILAERLVSNQQTENKNLYKLFNQSKENDMNFSDTSPLENVSSIKDTATSAIQTEVKNMINEQSGGGDIFVAPQSNDIFLNEELINKLLTENSRELANGEQSGGFFWNKKKNTETFISKDQMKQLFENPATTENATQNKTQKLDSATSENNTELNEYINNAVSELTSALENQKGGGKTVTSDSISSITIKNGSENNSESYVSSTAHTDGVNTANSTTISAGSEKYLSDSINTSDINMISVE